jgi:hypothetical protein
MILGDASRSTDYALDDAVAALALLELLPLGAPWTWADSREERRASTCVWVEKLVTVVTREPRLHREAVRAALRVFVKGPARDVWDVGIVRSAIRVALAPGGRQRLRRARRVFAGNAP